MAQVTEAPAFAGSADEQALARELLLVVQGQGRFFASGLPIRQSVSALAEYATARKFVKKDAAKAVEAAVRANPTIFALEGDGDALTVVTTREGLAPGVRAEDMSHSFAHRLTEPLAAPPPEPRVHPERPVINDNWYNEIVVPADAEDEEDADEAPPSVLTELIAAHQDAVAEPPLDTAVTPAEAQEDAAAELEEVVADAADVSTPAGALEQALTSDPRFVAFGSEYYLRDLLESYGRNDTRRVMEYIRERGEPLSDVDVLLDLYGKRRTDPGFAATCFSLNAHLATEKDFEFVGTTERRLWSVDGLPTIGSEKRKATDIGQDYRVLLDYPSVVDEAYGASAEEYVEHILTYYEYEYGVLPLDGELAQFFPQQYTRGQRAAVVTFEAPQHYLTFNVEIRFPTGNRGGFLSGFSTFFHENLIPGALFTIERGDTVGTYRIQYLQVSAQERKLLQVDEKKGKFAFKAVTFYCATAPNMVLTEQRLPRLAQMKPLDARNRRVLPKVIGAAFERIGENVGDASAPRYLAEFDDLYAVANIERPTSTEALRAILTSGSGGFSEEDGLYYYSPSA